MKTISRRLFAEAIPSIKATSVAMMSVPTNVILVLATLSILVELVTVAVFAQKNVMLYADGARFVFSLSTGNPWALVWHEFSTRLSAYALTVWPALEISQLFSLAPEQIAVVNCFSFYGFQIAVNFLAYWFAWKLNPRFLVFPVTQTILFSLLGWGFPSELLLAPGLLWIILFIAAKKQGPTILFLIGFAALIFTHELAFPSALVAGIFALYLQWRNKGADSRFWLAFLVIAATIAAYFSVRAHGGGAGSQSNLIYVFDPRRVLANPLLVPVVAGAFLLRSTRRVKFPFLLALSLLGFLIVATAGLSTSLNFDAPRYGARTLIAVGMLTLTVIFVFMGPEAGPVGREQFRRPTGEAKFGLAKWLFFCLGLQAGAIGVFVHDWTLLSGAENRLQDQVSAASSVISIARAREGWTPAQRDASVRLQVEWATPYRQFVLANGNTPRVILYDENTWYKPFDCTERAHIFGRTSRFEARNFSLWTSFTCSQAAPAKTDTLKDRLIRKIKHFLGK